MTGGGASQGDRPTTIGAQLRRVFPLMSSCMSRDGLAELLAEGRIAVGSDVDLASVALGVGVRAGTSHPDISTVDAFKQTLTYALRPELKNRKPPTLFVYGDKDFDGPPSLAREMAELPQRPM